MTLAGLLATPGRAGAQAVAVRLECPILTYHEGTESGAIQPTACPAAAAGIPAHQPGSIVPAPEWRGRAAVGPTVHPLVRRWPAESADQCPAGAARLADAR